MDNKRRVRPVIGNKRPPVNQSNYQRRPQSRPRRDNPNFNNRVNETNKVNKTYQNTNNFNPSFQEPKVTSSEAISKPPSKNRLLRLLLSILAVILALIILIIVYAKFSNLNPDLSGNIGLYNISSNAAAVASSHRIANIAVFGVDGRSDVEGDRSDTIIIGSADFEHNKLKVTSLMRDTYVEIADEDFFDKLNAAYTNGGPEESVKTINLNFDTAITDYVVFDFVALVHMVNSVGGVEINITDEDELYWLNQYLMDVNDKVGTADPEVTGIGPQLLTGSQALAYARIRYVGNGDFERTQRQRNVLAQVVAKVSAMNPIQQLNLIRSVLPFIKTSLRTSEIIKLALNFILMSNREIQQSRLPTDEYQSTGYLDDVSYVFPNTLVDNIVEWYHFVYEINYTPSETAREISEEIEETWY